MVAEILWARHGENVANLTRTFSYRVFDGDLTDVFELQEKIARAITEVFSDGSVTSLFDGNT